MVFLRYGDIADWQHPIKLIGFYQYDKVSPLPSAGGERLVSYNRGRDENRKAPLTGGFDPVLIENYKKINVRGVIIRGHVILPGYHLRQLHNARG